MGATFSRVKSWISGETLTHTDLNAEFDNILTNLTPAGVDDQSTNAAAMQATADPYPGAVASLATSLAEELQRLRYVIAQITGETYWYIDPDYSLAGGTVIADTISEKTGAAGVTIDSLLIKDGGISDGTNIIKTKIINIGDWNMDSTATVTVAHGLTFSKIRNVTATLISDDGSVLDDINLDNSSGTGSAGIITGSTVVNLYRKDSGPFDSAAWDSTSYNRGYITITYVV